MWLGGHQQANYTNELELTFFVVGMQGRQGATQIVHDQGEGFPFMVLFLTHLQYQCTSIFHTCVLLSGCSGQNMKGRVCKCSSRHSKLQDMLVPEQMFGCP